MKFKKIIVVVDFQNDFVGGSLGFPEAVALEKKIAKKIREERRLGGSIILFTKDVHEKNYLETQEGKNLPVEHCIENTEGAEIYGEVNSARLSTDLIIEKNAFGAKKLCFVLYELMEPDATIEFCGVVTNICVISNAILCKSFFPEAKIIIHADLCASFDKGLHEKALDVMESLQMLVLGR